MSKRPRTPAAPIKPYLTPTPDYWTSFLEAQNVIGHISESLEETQTQEYSSKKSTLSTQLHPDMIEWTHRIAEALVPLENVTAPEDRKTQIQKRQQIRTELRNALTGKIDFSKWFDETKTRFSIRLPEYVRIFYESLEGLKSQEAKELRQQYGEWVEKVNREYTPR